MSGNRNEMKRHFILDGVTTTERFRPPQKRFDQSRIPDRDRNSHGMALLGQFHALRSDMTIARQVQEQAGLDGGFGLQVEFESFPGIELAFESLARERSGIELLNVRHEEQRTLATVFVPDGKLEHFEGLIRDYLAEKRDRRGHARDYKRLINAIQQIRAATLRALWTDDTEVFPVSGEESFWWEVWLPIRGDRSSTVNTFCRLAEAQNLRVAIGELRFPERTVLLVYGSSDQLSRSVMTLNSIAELRRAKETAEFFNSLPPEEQSEWFDDFLRYTQFTESGKPVPHVCLLDTGVNNGHPLISKALANSDLHTVEPIWGTNDIQGHGTAMAGLALVGNLTEMLVSTQPLEIRHRLESVKLLPQGGANVGDAKHHGYLTIEAVARPEITAPERHRVFGMAITARDNRDRGRPSSWSSAVDRLAADADGEGARPRLLAVSAGNINDQNAWINYPNSNTTDSIHDPGQSWNALTVGAFTELVNITETNTGSYQPIAKAGGLSPFSTTSATWQSHWPMKPDVVFEGGNAAKDAYGAVWMPSLSLLTTHHKPAHLLFTTLNATSAATALAAQMLAQVMALYSNLWPETVRALIVHSAEWTNHMMQMFLPLHRQASKSDYERLIRHCGYGVPNLDRALWSVSNSLTMVVEAELHPFGREGSSPPTLRDMNMHRLPWPIPELEALSDTAVEMRVTLSYYIEPNPSERGVRSRYRYESHGLRFDVKRPLESEDDFRSRINAAARDEEEGTYGGGDDSAWLIGIKKRHKGSLHSDIWRGSAADLASRGVLAVYPALGWWKTRPRLERYNRTARYALIISIRTPEVDVDLYTAVANKLVVEVES
ncbi:MAG: S8 family peptidase [Dethiobacter sp.]|nr:S8 family peptidase [Dethiobacter sp.]